VSTISHIIDVDFVPEKDLQKLKRICQAWMVLDGENKEYAINHSESNKGSCPLCAKYSKQS
jgi:hypothetical protein